MNWKRLLQFAGSWVFALVAGLAHAHNSSWWGTPVCYMGAGTAVILLLLSIGGDDKVAPTAEQEKQK